MPFISFIMPVYNAEKDLPATLSSIINQYDGDCELICVNDGSKDSSGDILAEAAAKYPFIKVFTQENQGITAARNAALSHATGEWLCFIDNDDILAKDAVKVIRQTAEPDCDIVYYQFERFKTSMPDQHDNVLGESRYIESDDILKLQSDCINRFNDNVPLVPHTVLPTPWAKIYRRSFLESHNLRFRNEVKHEEDVVFNFEVLSYASKAKVVDYVLYYYRWSVNSESHRYRPYIFENTKVTLAAYQDIVRRRYPSREDIKMLYQYRVLWELQYCVFLGPMHMHNPGSYAERKAQFQHLFDYQPYADVFRHVSTTKFEPRQSLLATLIKYRQFWLLNLLGKVASKVR